MVESKIVKREIIEENSTIKFLASMQVLEGQKSKYRLDLSISGFFPKESSKFNSKDFPLVIDVAEKNGEFLVYETYKVSVMGTVLYHKYQSFNEKRKKWNSPCENTSSERLQYLKGSITNLIDNSLPSELDNPLIKRLRGD